MIGDSEYTLSWTVDNPQIYGVIYIFTGTSVADTPLTTAVASSGSKTFTVPSGHNYVAFRLGVSNAGDEITYTNIMLNTGSEATPYENFGYKIPISSANTTTPVYLGEVESTRRIKKLVFDGTESWTLYNGNYYSSVTDRYSLQNMPCRCTHTAGGIIIDNGGVRLKVFASRFTAVASNLEEWKTYLQQQYQNGTPVTVWYVLAEPTTGIVNEPIRKIGDYADTLSMEQTGVQIPTLHGNTVIDVDTTLKPSEMYIKYQG